MNQKAPGKTLLQLTGIVLIITGLLALVGACSSIWMSNLMSSGQMSEEMLAVMQEAGTGNMTAGGMLWAGILSALEAVLYMVSGIFGVKFCNRKEKGKTCFLLGIAMLVLVVVIQGFNAMQGALSIIGVITAFIFPLFYTWGGSRNMQG